MIFSEFKRRFAMLPAIPASVVYAQYRSVEIARTQLSYWVRTGRLVKLRRGIYLLNRDDRQAEPGPALLANIIYPPSYVSCEYALARYGLIPEAVYEITSVTTRKTAAFDTGLGRFSYRRLKPALFWGYRSERDENGHPALWARPEKALLDFLYYRLGEFQGGAMKAADLLFGSYRLQNTGRLHLPTLKRMARRFGIEKMPVVAGAVAGMKP